jgi:sulfur carrier protein
MQVIVNGLPRRVPDGITVAQLLELEQEPVRHVLVEVNRVYLPSRQYRERVLRDGDEVEIIHPAFGG